MTQFKNGFTLLELLIYIAITSLVMLSVIQGLLILNRGRGVVSARSEVLANIRFAIEKMRQDIKKSTNIIIPETAGATSGGLEVLVSGSTVRYCVVSLQLYRSVNSQCDETGELVIDPISAVDSLSFTRLENTNAILAKTTVSIEISLTMSYKSASPDWQYTGSGKTTVSTR